MPFRRRIVARLMLTTVVLAALACRFGVSGQASVPTATVTASPGAATLAAASPVASPTLPGRTAVLNDLVGDVSSRPAGGGKDVPASNGQTIDEGSQVSTGTQSKATVTLGDGTLLRLQPNTLVTLSQLITDPNNPVSRLLLALGKIFVILKSGQLDVQTPAGVATVSGSFMSVEYRPDTNVVVVTCLEGHCSLGNDQGSTALTTGQAARLAGAAGSSPVLRWMTLAEIQAWVDNNPEAEGVAPLALTALPTETSAASAETQTPGESTTPTESGPATASATPTATITQKPLPTFTSGPTVLAPSATPVPPTATPVPPSPTHIPPSPKPTKTPTLAPTSTNTPQPLVYSFHSACIVGQPNFPGNYHVVMTGPQPAMFTVMPQQTVTGQLAPGQYSIAWQPDAGASGHMDWNSNQGHFSETFC